MTPPNTDRYMAGRVLGGRYTLLAPVAQGGMGEVWKARDRETGRLVAAKVLRPELSGEELSLSRLRIEARNAMRVQHPNIASVLDSGEDDGRGWIVMELVDGRPLTDYLRDGARVAVEDLVPVLIQVALALDAAAAAGVVHRDIKPANILIRPDGVVKLTDFGISRTSDQANLTAAGMVMGTAQYLPPEQAMGETATSLSDLYALGVIAYEAAAGRRPFTGATQVDIAFSHVNDPVPTLPDDIPVPFARVVSHLLEKDPRHRPATGAALVRELVGAARTLDIPVDPHPLPAPADRVPPAHAATPSVIAPVVHEPRHVLPRELLTPPTTDEGGSRGPATTGAVPGTGNPHAGTGTGVASTLHAAAGTPAAGTAGSANTGSGSAGSGTGAPDPWTTGGTTGGATGRWRRLRPESTPAAGATPPEVAPGPDALPRRSTVRPQPTRDAATPPPRRAPSPAPASAPTPERNTREAAASVRRTSVLSRHGHGPAAAPTADTTASVRESVRWHPVAHGDARGEGLPHRRPPRTKYNRSVVAPPVSTAERIGQWIVVGLVVLTIILIAVATIQNRFGSLTSVLGAGTHVIEEVRTWLNPWTTV